MERITQAQLVETHLMNHGEISGREAWDLYGVYRLSEVVRKLRKKGDVIHTHMVKAESKYGRKYEYGVYVWGEQIKENNNE